MPYLIPLPGDIDKEKLEFIFKTLISRHESLRTSFVTINEEPAQKIHRDVFFSIPDYTSVSTFSRPFDLSLAPLIRIGILTIDSIRQILLVDMHHIITDGISERVLTKEFMSLYKGDVLSPLKLQYKDYSEWQNSDNVKDSQKQQEEYWLKEFEGEIPALNLPIDYRRPVIQSFEGINVYFQLTEKETRTLNEIARLTGTTLFMALLAVYNIFLSKICNQEDVVVGTGTAGRRHPDIQHIIGIFVNTLALRNYPSKQKSFEDFLKEVRKTTLGAFENQEYPFEELVEKVKVKRDTSRNPLFDVMFMLQNIDNNEPVELAGASSSGVNTTSLGFKPGISK
jgi:hypothetical protein